MNWIKKLFAVPTGPSLTEQYESLGIRQGLLQAAQTAMIMCYGKHGDDEAVKAFALELNKALTEAESREAKRLIGDHE